MTGIRITSEVNGESTVVTIVGWLRAENVEVLHHEIEQVRGPLVLDLAELQSADAAGIAALRSMTLHGAEFRGASGYIALLLRDTCNG